MMPLRVPGVGRFLRRRSGGCLGSKEREGREGRKGRREGQVGGGAESM